MKNNHTNNFVKINDLKDRADYDYITNSIKYNNAETEVNKANNKIINKYSYTNCLLKTKQNNNNHLNLIS